MSPDAAAIIVFIASFGLAVAGTLLAGRLGQRFGLVDVPGGRRTHSGRVARTGGVGLFAGFFLTALGLYLTGTMRPEHQLPLMGVLAGTAFAALFGLADDRFEFSAAPQFAAQIIAALIAISATVF